MPLIKRPTYDMLGDCLPWVDVAINPVNCKGVCGAGLALAFKEYCPEQYESYRAACVEGRLTIGKLHLFYNEKDKTTIVNFVTKNHWVDQSDLGDIELGVQALVRFLAQYPLRTVALPMLGTGLGKLEQPAVYAIFEKYLSDLPNVIFVCQRPDAFEQFPKYLMVGGSRKYTNYKGIESGIKRGLERFGLTFADFEAGVSGGARGVDLIAGGTGTSYAVNDDLNPSVFRLHNMKSVIAHADWNRFGNSAGFVRNKTLLEIGTHFVLFVGRRSVGTRMMQDLIEKHNRRADEIFKEECTLDHVPDYSFPMKPTKARKQLHVVDISNESE